MRNLKIETDAPSAHEGRDQQPGQDDASPPRRSPTYDGGKLTVQDFLRWARVLPPQVTGQLKTAPDSMLTRFARILSTNILLINQADSAGVKPTAEQWADMSEQYQAQLDTVKSHMDLAAAADSSASQAERIKVADAKVDAYMDQVLTGAKRLHPAPGIPLATVLRDRAKVELSDPGIAKALEIGRARQAAKDSTAKKDSAGRPDRHAAGPGPAPVPVGPGTGELTRQRRV